MFSHISIYKNCFKTWFWHAKPWVFLQQDNFLILKLCAVQRNISGKEASYDMFSQMCVSDFPRSCCIGIPPLRAGKGWMVPPALASAGLTLWQLQHVFNDKGWYLINQERWARVMCKTRQFYILWKVWMRGEIYETWLKKTAAVEGTEFLVWNVIFSNWGLNLFHMEALSPWVFRTAINLCGIV